MKIKLRPALSVFAAIGFCTIGLTTAQEVPAPTPEAGKVPAKPTGPSVRALLLVPAGPNTQLCSVTEAKTSEPFNVGALGLSTAFYPGARSFSLGVPDKNPEKGVKNVGTVTLPESGKDFILLLEPKGEIFQPYVVDAKDPKFGAGAVMFFNASDVSIGATLGSEKSVIKPRTVTLADAPLRKDLPYYQVSFYQAEGTSARLFGNTRWPHRSESRVLVFFFKGANGRIAYQAVDDSLVTVPANLAGRQ